MADPRFFDNRGPFSAADLCRHIGAEAPQDGGALIHDVAGLTEAGPQHVTFLEGPRAKRDFEQTQAGWCLVSKDVAARPDGLVLLRCDSAQHAFARAAALFYLEHRLGIEAQATAIHPSARIAENAVMEPNVVIGPGAKIGEHTRIGAGAVIGRGVTIGAGCEIGAHAWIAFAHIGDGVMIFPGVCIGAPGFGFASDRRGHMHVPQLGRVIIQDRVEIGANSTVDRGALGDTVIGEGTKLDNLVQIGHNTVMGRHCIMAGQSGTAGSVRMGDFVIIGGAVGVGDHAVIGDGARVAGFSAVWGELEGGQDYGGIMARPAREWQRELLLIKKLAKDWKKTRNE